MSRVLSRRSGRAASAVALIVAAAALSACSDSGNSGDADLVAGKKLFVQKCGSCHILNRAGSKGLTGPNLDEAFHRAQVDGFGDDSVRGMVYQQIKYPSVGGTEGTGIMPADLVDDEGAKDVAAYVALVAAKPGEDSGLLASAVPKPGAGKPIAAENGTLTVPADPTGQLAYTSNKATAEAGQLKIVMPNESGVPHNIVIDGKGETDIIENGETDFTASFTAGEFDFYCSVEGHRAGGMEGKLTVE